jgi:hypothetical protein
LGFFEIDMVGHRGASKIDREFVCTLTLTDITSGWTRQSFESCKFWRSLWNIATTSMTSTMRLSKTNAPSSAIAYIDVTASVRRL